MDRTFCLLCRMSEPLILLHGALGSAQQMLPLSVELQSPSLCLDFPGHGKLVDDEGLFTVDRFVQHVFDKLNEPVELVGYSLGGYVAIRLDALHPEMVKRVVAIATKFNWTPEGAQIETRMLNPEKVKEKVPAFAKLLEERHGQRWPTVMQRTVSMMLDLGNAPVLTASVLEKVECPVLLIRGSEDNMVSEEESRWAQNLIADARYVEMAFQPHQFEKMDAKALASIIDKRGFN